MKKIITSTIAILAFTVSFAQEKGDNYLGLNFASIKNETNVTFTESESKFQSIGINFSHFIKSNRRVNLLFGVNNSTFSISNGGFNPSFSTSDGKGYNINLGYGILFPLLKNFYAEATPNLGYAHNKTENKNQNIPSSTSKSNSYNLGLNGGLLWVPFKHFGLSTSLLSLSSGFGKTVEKNNNGLTNVEGTTTTISLSTSGGLENQSFTIFYKF